MRRRTALGAAAAALAAPALTPSPARAADAYDTLRERWTDQLTGGAAVDPADPDYTARLQRTGSDARGHQSTMAPATGSLWPDLPLNQSASITASYKRLATMAYAIVLPGTGSTGSTSLTSAVNTGLAHLEAQVYRAGATHFGNWWDWQIGAPQALLDTCALLYASVPAAQLARYLAAVEHFVPDPTDQLSSSAPSTGANRVDLCRVTAIHGTLAKRSDRLAAARDALSVVFPYVTSGDGFYRDGSFVQHGVIAYTGTYGSVQLGGLARLFALLAGTAWAVTDPQQANVYAMAERAFGPVVFNGVMLDAVRGRAISRESETDNDDAHSVVGHLLRLAQGADSATAARLRSTVKGWLQRNYYRPLLAEESVGVAEVALVKAVLANTAVAAAPEPTGHTMFAAMDRAVHRRPGWLASIAMSSARIAYYEHGNGENVRGFHTGAGMLAVLGDKALGQYTDAFWPTVDPYRLPGITVSRLTLPDGAGGAWGAARPAATWVGGVTDGEFAGVGMFVNGLQSTLRAKKSWFLLDDTIICLGAAISATDGVGVETVIDNRNLGAAGAHALTVDGVVQPATLGWSTRFSGPRWLHLGGFGGYVLGGTPTHARREARAGSWRSINGAGSTETLTRRYLTLWLDHGVNPTAGAYAYQLLPFATTDQTAARSADTAFLTVLANTDSHQGVRVSSRGVTAANFWLAGTVGALTSDQPAAVLVREQNGRATVCVSDPRRAAATVTLTWDRPVSSVISKDPSVTVVSTGSRLVLRFATGGTLGASHRAVVQLA